MIIGVYGTLKRGSWNNRLLKDSEFVGEARIPGFRLYASGIPYAVEDLSNKEYKLLVELFSVTNSDVLIGVDHLEGHPVFYERKPFNHKGREVWIYTYPKEHLAGGTPEITSGEY